MVVVVEVVHRAFTLGPVSATGAVEKVSACCFVSTPSVAIMLGKAFHDFLLRYCICMHVCIYVYLSRRN